MIARRTFAAHLSIFIGSDGTLLAGLQIPSSNCKLGMRHRPRFGKIVGVDRRAPVQRPAIAPWIVRVCRLRKLNHSPLSQHCRLAGLLSLGSRPLSGNSVQHAESNSPPRFGPLTELRRGPRPDSVHSFFGRFERSSPRRGGAVKFHFCGWIGIFATWLCHNLCVWAQLRRRRFKFRNVFHIGL
jgi:hypothetical protein